MIPSLRIHSLDQLWLGSLLFGSRIESCQGMTASRNTILRCGLDQDMKCCQGLEEIITSFRNHGLDQLWLGSLWFGSRGESRQGMTASRNTILRCGLDQYMKCCQGLGEIITSFRIHGLDQLWLG